MCTKDQYDSWASDWDSLKADSVIYSNCEEKLVAVEEAVKYANRYHDYVELSDILDTDSPKHDDAVDYMCDEGFMTCDDFDDYTEDAYYEEFVTPGGETVVAFGNYGWDG